MKKKIKYVSFAMAIMMLLSAFATVPALAKTVKKPETPAVKYIWSEMKGQIIIVAPKDWKAKVKPDGYQMAYSQDKTFKTGTKYVTHKYMPCAFDDYMAIAAENLSVNKVYYGKVRAYNNDGKSKVYSEWSNSLSIKVANKTNVEVDIRSRYKKESCLNGASVCSACGYLVGSGYNNTCYYFGSLFSKPPKGMKDGCNHFGTRSSNVKIGKVTGFKKINTYGGLILNWNTVKYADGYQIKYSTNKKFKNAKYVNANTNRNYEFSPSKVKTNTKYYLKVRAYMKNGNGKKYGPWSSAINGTTKITQPFGIKIKAGKKKMTVSCKDYYGFNQRVLIKYSTSKKFKNPKYAWMPYAKAEKTVRGLKSGKTYYVKLKGYAYDINGKVVSKSSYTKVYKVKIK